MAQIPSNLLKNWKDGDVVKAGDYKLDRDSIVVAHNDTDTKINALDDRMENAEVNITSNQSAVSSLQTNKTDKTGNHLGTWQGLNPVDFDSGQQAIDLNNHKKDYVVHPVSATTGGSNNDYTITVQNPPTGYLHSLGVVLTVHEDSTGNATLNMNSLGARPIITTSGKPVTNLKANVVYSLRYSLPLGSFILQGEGSDPESLITITNSILSL